MAQGAAKGAPGLCPLAPFAPSETEGRPLRPELPLPLPSGYGCLRPFAGLPGGRPASGDRDCEGGLRRPSRCSCPGSRRRRLAAPGGAAGRGQGRFAQGAAKGAPGLCPLVLARWARLSAGNLAV